jgi:hypothetical protein
MIVALTFLVAQLVWFTTQSSQLLQYNPQPILAGTANPTARPQSPLFPDEYYPVRMSVSHPRGKLSPRS